MFWEGLDATEEKGAGLCSASQMFVLDAADLQQQDPFLTRSPGKKIENELANPQLPDDL